MLKALSPLLLLVSPACFQTPMAMEARTDWTLLYKGQSLDNHLFASIGDALQADFTFETPALKVSQSVSRTMPGYLGIHFDFGIDASTLPMSHLAPAYEYFAAQPEMAHATYKGQSVLADGDQVGIRRNRQSQELEWYVDNTIRNFGNWQSNYQAVWTTPLTELETESVHLAKVNRKLTGPLPVQFLGYNSEVLRFETIQPDVAGRPTTRELRFDRPKGETETLVEIGPYRILVLDADSLGIAYRWISWEGVVD
jgi:hypothetical protein